MILLFSGGVDSFVAYHYLKKPKTVYFDLNSRYSEKEKAVIKNLIPDTIIDYSLDLHDREYGEKAYIPFRNLLLACQATKYSDVIVIAGIQDDMVSDKNEPVFLKFSELLTELEGRSITVFSPFWKMTKAQVIKWYLLNIGDSEIIKTVSCYSENPLVTYCGKCPSCFRKWCAFQENGIKLEFHNEELMQEYYESAKSGKYIPERNESIIKVIDEYRNRH